MRTTDRLAIAVAAAMVLGSASLTPLTVDRSFWWMAAVAICLLQGVSLVLRRLELPGWLVHLVQLLVLVALAVGLGLYSQPAGAQGLSGLWQLWNSSVIHIRMETAPMGFQPGVRWVMVVLVGLVTILADMLVLTLLSPAWMLAPLLALYLVPALALDHDVRWPVFILLGAAYLMVLAVDAINTNASWTRNIARDSAHKPHSTSSALRLAALVAVPTLALALLLGSVVPRLGSLDIESARPRGSGPLQMADPSIDLSKNLNLPVDRVVLSYSGDQPLYLRTASLTVMDADGWHMAPVKLADGALPVPPGLSQQGEQVTTTIQVKDLGGEYLPAPYAPQSFDAEGRWRHDPLSLAIISTLDKDRTEAIRDKTYTVTSTLNDPGAENFTLAQPGTPPDNKVTSQVPADVPKPILDITHQVTKDAGTPVLKAAAIQRYLSDPRNFSYSTTAPPGDGFDVLVNFLTKDKAGYCVHFASTMALMARIEGIPSRVSVGFLPGEKVGDHYEVKASNMHAWPELYFEGYGWVRFEPTSRVAQQPEWSLVNEQVRPLPSASASGGNPSASASPSPSKASPSASASSASPKPAPATDGGLPWRQILTWLGGAALALLVLGLPALVRLLVRRRRLNPDAAAPLRVARAWGELRDSLVDHGHRWPHGTPREVADTVDPLFTDEGSDALGRLSLAVERSRYAREMGEVGDVAADVRQLRTDLRTDASFSERLLALLLPRSLWARAAKRLTPKPRARDEDEVIEDEQARRQQATDHEQFSRAGQQIIDARAAAQRDQGPRPDDGSASPLAHDDDRFEADGPETDQPLDRGDEPADQA
ncbi:DUF3488 and transglutaminase-like domain-containing protein [Luteococcus peritonei]|uniref:DUF3488 and transglutaminase-like domain-containing protein n=1 Tax=Luteococcus peritonei TaxID=88874 RepID=A0ABW4RR56_9ACTN